MYQYFINKDYVKGAVLALCLIGIGVTCVHDAYGQMSSSNYRMQSDSLNFGGLPSTSSSYSLQDTLGEVATGISSSSNFTMYAGFQQMQSVGLAVVPPSSVTLSPSFGGVSGGVASASTTFQVTTDDPAGYAVTLAASTSPALQSATDSFADYAPSGANPDYAFTYAQNASAFGFSPEGADISSHYKNNGSACGMGSLTSGGCWDGLATTSKTIVARTSDNQPVGTATTLNFKAASGSGHIQTNGTYVSTTIITITPQ